MKVAIYARYSSDNQREESIDAQVRAIRDYADKNGHQVVKVYIDEALTGTSDRRPNFLQMIDDSKKEIFEAVIIHKLDRFARNRYDSANYKKKLKDNGVRLISVLENLDSSPESIILESVLEGMAEYFSANLSREIKKGLRENALKGQYNGGPPPFGYAVHDKKYIIDEKESEIVKEIFRLYLAGFGYANIARELNLKYKTRKGGKFSKTTIRGVLINEKYMGVYTFGKRLDGKTLDKINPNYIKVENAVPEIVSATDFITVQSMLKSERKVGKMKKEMYLLTGKIYCGICGGAYTGIGYMTGKNKDNRHYQYGCVTKKSKKGCSNKNINKTKIEEYIIESLKKDIFNPHEIPNITATLIKAVNEFNSGYVDELATTKKQIAMLQAKIDRIWDLLLDGTMPKSMANEKITSLTEERDIAKEKFYELENMDYSWVSEEKINLYLTHTMEKLQTLDNLVEIKKIINLYVDKIYIHEDTIRTVFNIKSPNPEVSVIRYMELRRSAL